jgi:hypothetical protein
MFIGVEPDALNGKDRQAFRGGFLGIDSFGWSTLVVVTEATAAERAAAVERLAEQLVTHCGAPLICKPPYRPLKRKVALPNRFAIILAEPCSPSIA